jgi:hypothetical protein
VLCVGVGRKHGGVLLSTPLSVVQHNSGGNFRILSPTEEVASCSLEMWEAELTLDLSQDDLFPKDSPVSPGRRVPWHPEQQRARRPQIKHSMQSTQCGVSAH